MICPSLERLITSWKGYDSPAKFGAEISIARASLGIEPGSRIPIGVGFLGWQLDKPTYPTKDLLSIAFDSNVQAVWFAFGNNMGHWISFIRENDPRAGTEQAITVFVQVSSTEEALRAMKEWHVDVIVAQGCNIIPISSIQSEPGFRHQELKPAAMAPVMHHRY